MPSYLPAALLGPYLLLVTAATTLALTGCTGRSDLNSTGEVDARVTRVVDGDTLKVRLDSGQTDTVRLIGIDTPEVYGEPECGGDEASDNMKRLAQGKRVILTSDPTQDLRDRYDRRLSYVKLENGRSLELEQLKAGQAKVFVFRDNPFKRLKRYRKAESEARARQAGVWSC